VFNLLISGAQAYNQVGMFFAALVCLGIGGLLLGSSLYWRLHALRANGTIIGVIGSGTYAPVYRYTLPDGQTHEAKSDTSSGSTRGKETGRVVPLLISAHNLTEAREANSYLLEIIGLIISSPGVILAYVAVTAYPVTPMTWLMSALMLAYLGERAYKVFIPKGQRVSLQEWKKEHGMDGNATLDLSQVKPIEEVAPASTVTQQTMQKNRRVVVPLLLLFAVLSLGLGMYEGNKIRLLETKGLRAPGTVVRLQSEYNSGSHGGGYTYYPVVDYTTADHVSVEFKDSIGSNPPGHHPGDSVTVLYLADKPQKEAIIDRGLMNWLVPVIFILLGMIMAWAARATLRANEKA